MKAFLDLPFSVRWVVIVMIGHLASFGFDLGQPARVVFSLAFILTCPGVLLIDLLSLSDLPARAAVTVGASLAANTLVITVLLTFDQYSAETALITVSLIAFVVAVVAVRSRSVSPVFGGEAGK
jgi:hypothetical protein